jgi:predicted dithiol-disulfide oxidoreductase (DUF899 family)
MANRISKPSSRATGNLSSITSYSTRRGTRAAQAARGFVDALGNLSLLKDRDTTFVVISRAPLAKLEAYKAQKGWSIPWFSSFGGDFNYDFHVTLDSKVAPAEYNYRNKAEMKAKKGHPVLMEG